MKDNFKLNLLDIQNELKNYHRDREQLSYKYVQDRLSESIRNYYKEIKHSYVYLEQRNEVKVIKKLNNYE